MNSIIINIIFITIVSIIISVLYVYFGIIRNIVVYQLSLKWIPAFLLAVTIVITKCIDRAKVSTVLPAVAFLVCSIGDFVIVFPGIVTFSVGMVLFAAAYIIFGYLRMRKLIHELKPTRFLLMTCSVLTVVYLRIIVYVINEIIINQVENATLLINAVFIYGIIMIYAELMHVMYVVTRYTNGAILSCFGLNLFIISDVVLILNNIVYHAVVLEICVMYLYWSGISIIAWALLI